MGLILLDSNIVMDVLNGVGQALGYLDCLDDGGLSVISHIEVLAGTKTELQDRLARNLLRRYPRFDLTQPVAERASVVRRQTRLKLPDAILLATAEVHGLRFATRNTKDFGPGDHRIVVPYTLSAAP